MLTRLLLLACVFGVGCASQARQVPVPIPLPQPPRPVSELVEQLRAADAPSRASAGWALAGAGAVDAAVIQALMSTLEDPSEPVREAATWALFHVTSPGFERERLMDTSPKVLVLTKPEYPLDAYKKRVEGTVVVTLLISAIGKVAHAEIRESVPGLDEAALACVRYWQFEPAKRRGRPVACAATAPVTFRIY